jgi:hypothetical protein
LPASVLTAASVAVSNYSLFLLASDISTRRLASLLALFLAAGTLASMLTAEDPEWWQSNFSALGMGSAFSSRAFNLTVIIAGLVVTTLADYITTDLRARRWPKGQVTHGVGVVRTILMVVGIAFIGVGAVPVNDSQLVHNIFSILLIAGFTALIAVTPALLRELPWAFTAASTVFLGRLSSSCCSGCRSATTTSRPSSFSGSPLSSPGSYCSHATWPLAATPRAPVRVLVQNRTHRLIQLPAVGRKRRRPTAADQDRSPIVKGCR